MPSSSELRRRESVALAVVTERRQMLTVAMANKITIPLFRKAKFGVASAWTNQLPCKHQIHRKRKTIYSPRHHKISRRVIAYAK